MWVGICRRRSLDRLRRAWLSGQRHFPTHDQAILPDRGGHSLGTAVRESTWLFPTIESIHVLSLVLVVGSIMSWTCAC